MARADHRRNLVYQIKEYSSTDSHSHLLLDLVSKVIFSEAELQVTLVVVAPPRTTIQFAQAVLHHYARPSEMSPDVVSTRPSLLVVEAFSNTELEGTSVGDSQSGNLRLQMIAFCWRRRHERPNNLLWST